MQMARHVTVRNLLFIALSILVCIIYYGPLRDLFLLSIYYNELYSHLVIIPFVSAYFIYLKRKEILSNIVYYLKECDSF